MSTPPGWYNDGSGTQRWWDGQAWGQAAAAAPPAGPATPPGVGPQDSGFGGGFQGQTPGFQGAQFAGASYGGPAYAGPGFPGAAPVKKRRIGLTIGIVFGSIAILVIGGVIWGVTAFLGALNGPKNAINGFHDAYLAADCDAALEYASQDFLDGLYGSCDGFVETAEGGNAAQDQDPTISYSSVSIVNSSATVEATETFYFNGLEDVYRCTYYLANSGGWKITDMSCY